MPFSTSPEQGFVFAFGLPFIAATILLNITPILRLLFLKNNMSTLLLSALSFVLVPLITALLSPKPIVSMWRAVVFFLGYLFALWMISTSNRKEHLQTMIKAFFIGGVVLSTYYIVNFIIKGMEVGFDRVILERYVGGAASLPWGASGIISGVVLLTVVGYFIFGSYVDIKWGWLVPIMCVSAIALTFSRSGVLLSFGAFVVLALPTLKKSNLYRGVIVVLLTVFVLLLGGQLLERADPDAFEALLLGRLDDDTVSEAGGRTKIWADRFHDMPSTLFSPHGYYSVGDIYARRGESSPHNYFISTGLEQGILGIAVGALFWVLLFRALRRSSLSMPRYRWAWFIVLLNLFSDDLNFAQPYVMAFWSLFALCVAHRRLSVSQHNEFSFQEKTIAVGGQCIVL